MKHLGVCVAVLFGGCLDFDEALRLCQDGGRCAQQLDAGRAADSGVAPDAGASDSGTPDAGAIDSGSGVVDAGTVDGGMADSGVVIVDAGTPVDAGQPCVNGCLLVGMCILAPANAHNESCGPAGGTCVNCAEQSQVCSGGHVCVAQPTWRFVYQMIAPYRQITSLATVAAGNVWAAGHATAFFHHNGSQITDQYLGLGDNFDVLLVGDAGSAMVYLVGKDGAGGYVYRFKEPWDGSDKAPFFLHAETISLNTVFRAGTEVYAAGADYSHRLRVYRADAGWEQLDTSHVDAGDAYDGWGSASGDFYLSLASNELLHFEPGVWSRVPLPATPLAIWGTGSNRVYVVGTANMFGFTDGSGFSPQATGRNGGYWRGVWAFDDQNVFVIGSDATCNSLVLKWVGTGFESSTCINTESGVGATAVFGTSPSDVWVGLSNGKLYRLSP